MFEKLGFSSGVFHVTCSRFKITRCVVNSHRVASEYKVHKKLNHSEKKKKTLIPGLDVNDADCCVGGPRFCRAFLGLTNSQPANWRSWFVAGLLHLSLRVPPRPKSENFLDAENRQRPRCMFVLQVKDK
ncbi:hypothetical protein TNCV_3870131 [Trichonephila clavipes]|nr:hypothetical protein TNCV_3870131 [Trichonephila clavipes]